MRYVLSTFVNRSIFITSEFGATIFSPFYELVRHPLFQHEQDTHNMCGTHARIRNAPMISLTGTLIKAIGNAIAKWAVELLLTI